EEGLIDHVDPVQYTIRLLIPPSSALLSRPAIQPFLGQLDQASFFYQWSHPDPRMDHLYRTVRAIVEQATRASEDPAITFNQVRAAAYNAGGDLVPVVNSYTPLHERNRPPRLTESWFCCAEPTDDQFGTVQAPVDH
ncbi:MAG: CUAEP/CCAEP-tail radical SAM protein, partial [Bacteroidota bacterium]